MKKTNLLLLLLPLTCGLLIFAACRKSSSTSGGTARLEVRSTDDPSPYDAVLIDVEKVEVNGSSCGDPVTVAETDGTASPPIRFFFQNFAPNVT